MPRNGKPSQRKVPRKTTAKRGPRATVVSVHHAPNTHPLQGSEERLIVLRRRALQLKIYGFSLPAIAERLREEYELVETPARTTVYEWVEGALAEGLKGQKAEAEQYVAIHRGRAEEVIRTLMPFALDNFVVERTKVIDGERVKVIDADVLEERIKAAAEIRKQGESVLKAMGVYKPAQEQANGALAGDGIKMFVIQTVNNHIAKNGEVLSHDRAQKVLELTSGDPIIDGL